MKVIFTLAMTVFGLLLNAGQPNGIYVDTSIATSCGRLYGTLIYKDTTKAVPLVIFVSGSGPTDRDGNNEAMKNNGIRYLAESLLANGYASFRYDKRLTGESNCSDDEWQLRIDTFAHDLGRWVDVFGKDKRFSSIIIAGHSEGSLLGLMTVLKKKKVKGFVSLAGAGRPIDVILKEQVAHYPEDIKKYMFPIMDRVKAGDTVKNVPPIYYMLLRPSLQPYMHSWMIIDPAALMAKVKIPCLIVQGSTDLQVKEIDARTLAQANKNAKLEIIPEMNHTLKHCPAVDKKQQEPCYDDPSMPVDEKLVTVMLEFLRQWK